MGIRIKTKDEVKKVLINKIWKVNLTAVTKKVVSSVGFLNKKEKIIIGWVDQISNLEGTKLENVFIDVSLI